MIPWGFPVDPGEEQRTALSLFDGGTRAPGSAVSGAGEKSVVVVPVAGTNSEASGESVEWRYGGGQRCPKGCSSADTLPRVGQRSFRWVGSGCAGESVGTVITFACV